MSACLSMWGNSLAVRVPKRVAEQANLSEGSRVTITAEGGRLVVENARPKYDLDDLLAKMKPEHRREELDWGVPIGEEVW